MKTEAKDPKEYGFEGEMVMSQLKGIMQHAQSLHGMLKPNTDLPEWVQSKITLAYDYIQTATDYMSTEMNEETQIDEISGDLAYDYLKKSRKEFNKANSQHTKYRNIGKAATRPETKAKNAKLAKTYGDVADKRRKGSTLAWAKLNPDEAAYAAGTPPKVPATSLFENPPVKKHTVEEAPTNAAGSGSVEGIGVGPKGEPGVRKTKYQKKNAAEAPKSPVMDGMVRRKLPSFKQFMG